MKRPRLLRMEPPGPNQWMLFFAALTWSAVLGLEPPAWPPWVALIVATPWFLWPLPGTSLVRLVAFPGAMALHMAMSPPLGAPDLAGVLFLYIAMIGFSLSRPPAPSVDFRPVVPRGELRSSVPVVFLAWGVGLVLLTWWAGARAAWILGAAIFCAAHYESWRRLARVGRSIGGPLATLVLGTLLLAGFAAAWSLGGDGIRSAAVAVLVAWTFGVGRVKSRPAPPKVR